MTAPVTAPTTATLSNVLTNLDATPIVRAAPGQVGGRVVRYVSTITPTASQATSVLNRMVRIPSNAIVTNVRACVDATGGTTPINIGVWYSDDTRDGTNVGNAGNLTAISSAFFASVLSLGSVVTPTDYTFNNAAGAFTDGQYIPSQSYLPIWQAIANSLALQTTPVGAFTASAIAPHFQTASAGASVYVRSDDPGGFFDICVQLTSTGSSSNVKLTLQVDIIAPGS